MAAGENQLEPDMERSYVTATLCITDTVLVPCAGHFQR